MGDQSISSIRLKVKGASTVGEQSDKTLNVSSRKSNKRLVLSLRSPKVPLSTGRHEGDRWREDARLDWTTLDPIGAAMTIFARRASGSRCHLRDACRRHRLCPRDDYVSMLARRKEFAVLLALGGGRRTSQNRLDRGGNPRWIRARRLPWSSKESSSLVRSEAMNGWSLLWIALFSLVIYLAGAICRRGRFAGSHRTKQSKTVNTRKQLASDWNFVRRWHSH